MVLGSVIVDQVTKNIAEKNLMTWEHSKDLKQYSGKRLHLLTIGDQEEKHIENNFYLSFNFNYVRNQGAAWGAFSNLEDKFRVPFFYFVTIFAMIIILLYMKNTPKHHRLAFFALTLILSGALGNFTDRFRLGYVIDFLDVRWSIPLPFHLNWNINMFPQSLDFLNFHINTSTWQYNFPNFNWADSTITIGIIFLIYDMLVFEPQREKLKVNSPKKEKLNTQTTERVSAT
tara:strand:- start:697 stop:1386 length:690 start_codon:yes stop_codon:yes gene_type:complete